MIVVVSLIVAFPTTVERERPTLTYVLKEPLEDLLFRFERGSHLRIWKSG